MSTTGFICALPPSEVFLNYDYSRILHLLGVNCDKRPTTKVCACPKCRKTKLLVSPLESTSAWLKCQNCNLSGDPIKVYQQVYKIKDLDETFEALEADMGDTPPLNEDYKQAYIRFHTQYYNGIEALWKVAKREAVDWYGNGMVKRLNDLGLWLDQGRFDRGLKDLIGYTTKFKTFQTLGIDLHALRGKHMAHVLVFPYYLRPGLISGFGFIGRYDVFQYANLIPGQNGGFHGLTYLPMDKQREVYIVNSPLQVARAHLKAAAEGVPPMPMVAGSPSENPDWTALVGKPVFWVDEPEPTMLKKAIRISNAKIIYSPPPPTWKNTELPAREWRECFLPIIKNNLKGIERRSPIQEAANLLLGTNSFMAAEYCREMSLTQHFKTLMLNLPMEKEQKDHLENIMDNAAPAGVVQIGRKQIVEEAGHWYVSGGRNKSDELISEAILRIRLVQKREGDNVTLLHGDLLFDGTSIPVQGVEESLFRKSARKTCEYLCSKVGIKSYPYMTDFGSKNFLDIALQIRPPKVEFTQSYVGFDYSTGQFKLPQMSIARDNIYFSEGLVAICPHTPCRNLCINAPVTVANLYKWFKPGYETAGYWATMAGTIQCIWNNVSKNNRTGLILVGSPGSLAEHLFYLIQSDLQLIRGRLSKSWPENRLLEESANTHHMPVAIDGLASDRIGLKRWLERGSPNCIMLLDPLTAQALGPAKNWITVRLERKFKETTTNLLQTELVFPNFMKHILDFDPHNVKGVLDRMQMWVDHYVVDGTTTLDYARKLVSTQGVCNANSEAFYLVSFLMRGIQKGIFHLLHGSKVQKGTTVLINDHKDTVTLQMDVLHKQLKHNHLPVYDWDEAIFELEQIEGVKRVGETNSGIEMPRPIWNSLILRAKRLANIQANLGKTFNS
jgi:hypothetical protein